MSTRHHIITLTITLVLSFLIQGINDFNTFIFSNWRMNNVANILHVWFLFFSSYYLYSYTVELGFKQFVISNSNRLIGLLFITQILTFLWFILVDILYYILYYEIQSLSETTFLEFDLPLAIVILTIGSIYFYQKYHLKPVGGNESNAEKKPSTDLALEVYKGSKSILISHTHIAFIHLADKIVWVTTLDQESFQTNYSLAQLADLLSSDLFFRLNRQLIISRLIIQGYDKLDYQKLEVILKDGYPRGLNLVISKYNAPAFKNWLTNSG